MSGPSLKYPGAKWGPSGQTALWITSHLPSHKIYCEPFFGSGGVFFTKAPSMAEYINDLDGEIVNLFKIMRDQPQALIQAVELTPYALEEYHLSFEVSDDPLEQARRTLVKHWMSIGANGHASGLNGWRHLGKEAGRSTTPPAEWDRVPERLKLHAKRLKNAHIDNLSAIDALRRINGPKVLAYIDPPYLKSVRRGRLYRVEMMEDTQHLELLTFLTEEWKGMALLSGYAHPLYDDYLKGWQRLTLDVIAEKGKERTEALWINPAAQQHRLF